MLWLRLGYAIQQLDHDLFRRNPSKPIEKYFSNKIPVITRVIIQGCVYWLHRWQKSCRAIANEFGNMRKALEDLRQGQLEELQSQRYRLLQILGACNRIIMVFRLWGKSR